MRRLYIKNLLDLVRHISAGFMCWNQFNCSSPDQISGVIRMKNSGNDCLMGISFREEGAVNSPGTLRLSSWPGAPCVQCRAITTNIFEFYQWISIYGKITVAISRRTRYSRRIFSSCSDQVTCLKTSSGTVLRAWYGCCLVAASRYHPI